MSETIIRACGHFVEFVPAEDGFDEGRREKLRTKRCQPCGLAKNLADNATQTGRRAKKGSEVKLLPCAAVVTLCRQPDGSWFGTLTAECVTVEATMAGAMGIVSKLARKWLQARGVKLTGKVQA